MLHLSFKGILGRKKETALLLVVLLLSFMFASLIAVLLPSTDAGAQQKREQSYGAWKLMLADENKGNIAAVGTEAVKLGCSTAQMPRVGQAPTGETLSAMTDELESIGNFSLLDGRMPQAEDEIAVVFNQFMPQKQLMVGDEVAVELLWDVECTQPGTEDSKNFFSNVVAPYLSDNVELMQSLWAEGNSDMVFAYRACGVDLTLPYNELDGETRQAVGTAYLINKTDLFSSAKIICIEKLLIPNDSFDIAVMQYTDQQNLRGDAFAQMKGKIINLNRSYENLSLRRTYKVTGVIAPYEATWNGGEAKLADAFLSTQGWLAVEAALTDAHLQLGDFEYTDRDIATLMIAGGAEPDELYNSLAKVYANALPKVYNLIYGMGTSGGVIEAQNAITGEPQNLPFDQYGTRIYPRGMDISFDAVELNQPSFKIEGYEPVTVRLPQADELYIDNSYTLRINSYAFPHGAKSASGTLSMVLNGALTIMTACAILVICFVQNRRRVQGLILLRSIGLQIGQGFLMQLCEGVIFLLAALTVGLPLGAIGAYAVLSAQGIGELFAIDTRFLIISVVLGSLSTVIGLLIPAIYAARREIVGKRGAINPPRRKPRELKSRGFALLRMELTAHRFNSRRDLVARLLCGAMILIALITLLLFHTAFSKYRTQIERTDMPDYTYTERYGMNRRFTNEVLERLLGEEGKRSGASRVDAYLQATHVELNGQGLTSPILNAMTNEQGKIYTDVVGLFEDSDIMQRLLACCPSDIDTSKLYSAEGCILIVPSYLRQGDGSLKYSTDAASRYAYLRDDGIGVGDSIELSALTHTLSSETGGMANNISTVKMKVLAIITTFDERGVWPFSAADRPYTVVSGSPVVSMLYPNSGRRLDVNQARWLRNLQMIHCTNCDGTTVFHIYTNGDDEQTSLYWNLSREQGYQMTNYLAQQKELYSSCQNQRTMTLLLGAVATMLVIVILMFILGDLAQQSRVRMGILRSLGASSKGIALSQVVIAMWDALKSVILANAILVGVLFVAALAETGFSSLEPQVLMDALLKGILWQYPWDAHAIIAAGSFALITLLRSIPFISICQKTAIEMTREQ